MESKIEEKYKRLKKNLNNALNANEQLKYENIKLHTKIEHYKKRLRYLKHERDILIEKIQQYGSDSESASEASAKSEDSDVDSDASDKKNQKNKNAQEEESTSKRKSRSKRKRGNSIRRAQHVDTDENGKAILPIRLGVMTLHDLGTVVYDREAFHNERYIFPVGYTLSRRYFSMVKLDEYVNYRCVVKDGGNAPIFEVTPEDAEDKKTSASSPTGAWISIVKAVNEMRNKDHSNSASGPDYFGFTSSTIAKLIQDLPNADKCKNYRWQKFETTSGRSLKKATLAARNELLMMENKEKERLLKEKQGSSSMSVDEKKADKPKKEAGGDEDIEIEEIDEMDENSQDNVQEETEGVETETTHGEDDEEMDEIEEDEEEEEEEDNEEMDKGHSSKRSTSPKKKGGEMKKQSIETEDTIEDDEDEIEEESDDSDSDNNTKASVANESQATTDDE